MNTQGHSPDNLFIFQNPPQDLAVKKVCKHQVRSVSKLTKIRFLSIDLALSFLFIVGSISILYATYCLRLPQCTNTFTLHYKDSMTGSVIMHAPLIRHPIPSLTPTPELRQGQHSQLHKANAHLACCAQIHLSGYILCKNKNNNKKHCEVLRVVTSRL